MTAIKKQFMLQIVYKDDFYTNDKRQIRMILFSAPLILNRPNPEVEHKIHALCSMTAIKKQFMLQIVYKDDFYTNDKRQIRMILFSAPLILNRPNPEVEHKIHALCSMTAIKKQFMLQIVYKDDFYTNDKRQIRMILFSAPLILNRPNPEVEHKIHFSTSTNILTLMLCTNGQCLFVAVYREGHFYTIS